MTNQLPPAPQPALQQQPQQVHNGYPTQTPQPVYLVAVQAAPVAPKNGTATGSLVMGIIGVFFALSAWVPVLGFFTGAIGLGLGLPAVITGYKGAARAREIDGIGSGAATTGMIFGWIACGLVAIVSVVVFALFFFSYAATGTMSLFGL